MELAAKIKLPIQVNRFEINWSAGKIRSPRASGRVLTYTLIILKAPSTYACFSKELKGHLLKLMTCNLVSTGDQYPCCELNV